MVLGMCGCECESVMRMKKENVREREGVEGAFISGFPPPESPHPGERCCLSRCHPRTRQTELERTISILSCISKPRRTDPGVPRPLVASRDGQSRMRKAVMPVASDVPLSWTAAGGAAQAWWLTAQRHWAGEPPASPCSSSGMTVRQNSPTIGVVDVGEWSGRVERVCKKEDSRLNEAWFYARYHLRSLLSKTLPDEVCTH